MQIHDFLSINLYKCIYDKGMFLLKVHTARNVVHLVVSYLGYDELRIYVYTQQVREREKVMKKRKRVGEDKKKGRRVERNALSFHIEAFIISNIFKGAFRRLYTFE